MHSNPKKKSVSLMAGLQKFYQRSYGLAFSEKGLLHTAGASKKAVAKKYTKRAKAAKPSRKRGGWTNDVYGHAVAAKIGWGYRKYARDLRSLYRHAARPTKRGKQKGLSITERSLRSYRKARSLSERRLESRRRWYTESKRKSPRRTYTMAMSKAKRRWGSLYNRKRSSGGRGASTYQKFVAQFIRSRKVSGPKGARGAMKAAAAAWRRGGKRRVSANPVLPFMAYNNKSVYRTRSGKYGKRGYRKLARISGGGWHANSGLFRRSDGQFAKRGGSKLRRYKGGGWRSNPVLPMAVQMNKKRRGGRRFGYRNNPVLPYMAYNNPIDALTGTVSKLTDVELWTKTILPIAGGFIGARIVSYQVVKLIGGAKFGTDIKFDGIVKHGATLGTSVLLSAGVGIATKDTDMAAKVLAGGLVAFLGGLLDDMLGADYKKLSGMGDFSSLADDLTDELKSRIAAGVQQQIEQGGGQNGGQVSSFVTQQDLNVAPRLGSFVTQQDLSNATVRAGGAVQPGTGRPESGNALADLSTFQDAMADGSLI
jgi:hypothetical protein